MTKLTASQYTEPLYGARRAAGAASALYTQSKTCVANRFINRNSNRNTSKHSRELALSKKS